MDDYVVELRWSALSKILDPTMGSVDLERIFNQCARTISLRINFGGGPLSVKDYQVYPNSTVGELKERLPPGNLFWAEHKLRKTEIWSELGVEDGATLSLVPLPPTKQDVRNEIYDTLGPESEQGDVIFQRTPPRADDAKRVDNHYLFRYYGLEWDGDKDDTNLGFGLDLSTKDVVHFPDTMEDLPYGVLLKVFHFCGSRLHSYSF